MDKDTNFGARTLTFGEFVLRISAYAWKSEGSKEPNQYRYTHTHTHIHTLLSE